MPGLPPPPDFAAAKLEIETISTGRTFGRIYWSTYPNPLGYGKSPSRFSDPRRRVDVNRFGVLYLGDSLKVCFLETVLRDRREGIFDDLPIEEVELIRRRYAEIATTTPGRPQRRQCRSDGCADRCRSGTAPEPGAPVVAGVSRAPSEPDGVIYPSRLNGATNLAIYDRAVPKLQPKRVMTLLGAPGLAQVLEDFRVGLV
ncbi:RES family NAD+ phosphorylase [Mesorhizobium sp. M1169]|uniref:RES family NAD+ phosphorylase n=1 Tax=Mesorhizobium sp. M1169 TaxID=2957066 RepID=UPI003336EB49